MITSAVDSTGGIPACKWHDVTLTEMIPMILW
jgi:hypothetical protein